MDYLENLKNFIYWQNSLYDYLISFIIFIGVLIVLKIFQVIVLSRLRKLAKKTKTDFDDALIDIFTKIKPPFYFFVALYFAVYYLSFPEIVSTILNVLIIVSVVFEVIQALQRLVDYLVKKQLKKMDGTPEGKKQSRAMVKATSLIVKVLLWVLGVTLILANLGINVTSIIASLGIGGIAIALALQNILSDMFNAFSIYIDKPFQIGDYITVGPDSGTVEKIGLKSTRIRTLQGEELVISNSELTSARIQNFKSLEKRRDTFDIGVVYNTTKTKLEKIPRIIKKIMKEYELLEFDRCVFKSYGDSALIFEVVYYVHTSEFGEFAKVKHQMNIDIFTEFGKEGIDFAYPTQTLYINREES